VRLEGVDYDSEYFDRWRLLTQAVFVTVFIALWHLGFRYSIKKIDRSEIGLTLLLPFWSICLWFPWTDAYFAFVGQKEKVGLMTMLAAFIAGGYAAIATIAVWLSETFGKKYNSVAVALLFWVFVVYWMLLS
jgi:hypothetical protein